MSGSAVICRIERAGGSLKLRPDGTIACRDVPPGCLADLRANEYLVRAILRERLASRLWELSGKDPNWWRSP